MNEKDTVYEIEIEPSYFDDNHNLKPYVYQNLFGQVIGRHLKNWHADIETISRHGLAWVLVSLSFEIAKPLRECEKLFAATWYSGRRGPFFRREILFKNARGETVFSGSTFSVLLNLNTRTVYRHAELPFLLTHPVPEYTVTADPLFKTGIAFTEVERRPVRNSHIDLLGHVNNTRYMEFAYDTLDEEELLRMPALKRIDIYFISEVKNKETLTMMKAHDGGKILVRGYNEAKKCVAFETVMAFS